MFRIKSKQKKIIQNLILRVLMKNEGHEITLHDVSFWPFALEKKHGNICDQFGAHK